MDGTHGRDGDAYNGNRWHAAFGPSHAPQAMANDMHMAEYTVRDDHIAGARAEAPRQQQQQQPWQAPWGGPSRPFTRQEPRHPPAHMPIDNLHPQSMRGHLYSGAFGDGNVSAASSGIYAPETPCDTPVYHGGNLLPAQQHTPYTGRATGFEPQGWRHQQPDALANHARGAATETLCSYDSSHTPDNTYAPFAGSLRSKPSHQHLLIDQGRHPATEFAYHDKPRSPPSVYSPPAQPAMQHPVGSGHVLRGKSIRDRYDRRHAGGDSGMGACCECCCGGCIRCACCAACCCLGPVLTTILVVLALVGIALALYFNWSRITGASQSSKKAMALAANAAGTLSRRAAACISGHVRLQAVPSQI